MPVRRSTWVLLSLMLLPAVGLAAEVTIYRCTDNQGRLTLRDNPCKKGEQQEARTMLKPQDPPARGTRSKAPTPAPGVPSATITSVVVVTPPRQVFECVAPDGTTYLSDSGHGELRWHAAHPYVYGHHLQPYRSSDHGLPTVARPRTLDGRVAPKLVFDNIGRPTPRPPRPPRQGPGVPSLPPVGTPIHGGAYAAGAWLGDPCQPLPQEEACVRLRDRRYELDRRYNSALQSERIGITREQRGIDARLSAVCGGS